MISTIAVLASKLVRSQAGRLVLIGSVCLLAGAGAFAATQHRSMGTGLYWALETATTVGYGDVTPSNAAGRIVASLVMLTTIPLFASAFASFAGAVASTRLRRLLGMEHREPSGREVVMYGMHPALPVAARELVKAKRDVVVVTTAERSAFPDEVHVVVADPTTEAGMRRGHPEKAAQVLIAGEDDSSVLVTAVLVHQVAPQAPTLAIASSPHVCQALHELGIDAVSGDELLAHTIAKSLEAPHAGELLLAMLNSEGFRLREVPVGEEGAGHPISALRDRQVGVVVGAVHDGHVVMGVVDDPVLGPEDRLLVLAPEPG